MSGGCLTEWEIYEFEKERPEVFKERTGPLVPRSLCFHTEVAELVLSRQRQRYKIPLNRPFLWPASLYPSFIRVCPALRFIT